MTQRIDGRNTASHDADEAYRLLFEQSGEMVCMLDLEGRFISVNPAGERLTGYAAADLVGRLAVDLVVPELREEAVRQFQIRLEGEPAPSETEILTRDGRSVPVQVTSTLVSSGGRRESVLGLIIDLTGQRDAKTALRAAEARFRASFESAAIGEAIVGLDGRFLEVNRALCEIVGYSEAELLTRTFQDITHPDDLESDLQLVRQILAGEIRTYQMEKRYLDNEGNHVWALLNVSLVRGGTGEPSYLIALVQDITERRSEREKIAMSEMRLAEAQRVARMGSWEWDVEADVVHGSDELYAVFGVERSAELTRDRYLDCVHPDDREAVMSAGSDARRTGEPYEIEYRVVMDDGAARWIHERGQLPVRRGGRSLLRGTVQDITNRRVAEEKLREAEARYRTLIEQLPLVTYIRPVDMSLPNIYASPQVEAMLGHGAEEWQTNPNLLAEIVHPDDRDRVIRDASVVRLTGEPYRDEYRYVTPDGRVVWVQDETHVVVDEKGESLVQGFLLDITERKRAEAESDRLREELHRAQKLEAIGRLAGGVAHDFNNMLTAIRGYSELLLNELQPGTQPYHEAQQIRRAAEQAASLPQQLLAFARKQTLESKLVDLSELVSASAPLVRHLVGEKSQVRVTSASGPAFAYIDPDRVEQMLVNLALNARDALPRGGTVTMTTDTREISGETTVEGDTVGGSFIVISVTDDGTGMDAETRARAFEPFFTTKPQGRGSGLGLASVHGTILQSGGFATIDSEPGKGTSVRLHFPAVAAPADVVVPEVDDPPAGARVALLAEDEDLVRDLVRSVLKREGYRVHASRNGIEALEHLDRIEGPIDLLVTDLVMPRMSGRELADRVVEKQPNVQVVFISGYSEESADLGRRTRPGSAFVSKPFSPSELVEAVRAIAGGRREPGGVRDAAAARTGLVTCVIADDHPAVLDSVSRYLEAAGFDVVARASRADEALGEIEARKPMTALLDIRMEPFSGIEIARRAAESSPGTGVVLYTGHSDQALLTEALDAGARGFVLKETPLAEIAKALTTVARGGTYVDTRLAGAVASAGTTSSLPALTKRERQILTFLSGGMTNDKVAAELGISAETVQSHVHNAMTKLDADTRTQAVATAIRQALIV